VPGASADGLLVVAEVAAAAAAGGDLLRAAGVTLLSFKLHRGRWAGGGDALASDAVAGVVLPAKA
jgi:hypothetical protein